MTSLADARRSRCRSCDAPIVWVVVGATGKRMPVDPEPVPTGNVEVLPVSEVNGYGETPVVKVIALATRGIPTEVSVPPRYLSHFATCPNADSHRRPR